MNHAHGPGTRCTSLRPTRDAESNRPRPELGKLSFASYTYLELLLGAPVLGHVLGAKVGIARGEETRGANAPRLDRAKHIAHALARQCSTWSIRITQSYHLAWNCSRSCHVIGGTRVLTAKIVALTVQVRRGLQEAGDFPATASFFSPASG